MALPVSSRSGYLVSGGHSCDTPGWRQISGHSDLRETPWFTTPGWFRVQGEGGSGEGGGAGIVGSKKAKKANKRKNSFEARLNERHLV